MYVLSPPHQIFVQHAHTNVVYFWSHCYNTQIYEYSSGWKSSLHHLEVKAVFEWASLRSCLDVRHTFWQCHIYFWRQCSVITIHYDRHQEEHWCHTMSTLECIQNIVVGPKIIDSHRCNGRQQYCKPWIFNKLLKMLLPCSIYNKREQRIVKYEVTKK